MSQVVNQLATIEIGNEILQHVDVVSIVQNFGSNYRKLDDLKKFRTEYEKKNALIRWWHNDKLRDAQLDSVAVQAEFSKTIGQLMVLSIMQSKMLSEQQTKLNDQQGKLEAQANGIAEHAGELQKQHRELADQSAKQETLVREYFALKGLTDDGAQKLVEIAKEVRTTKEEMLQEFAARAKDIEARCNEVASQTESMSERVHDQIRLNSNQTQSAIARLQQETHDALISNASALRDEHEILRQANNLNISNLEQGLRDAEAHLLAKCDELRTGLSGVSFRLDEQGAAHQEKLRGIEGEIDTQVARTTEIAKSLSVQEENLAICIRQQQAHNDDLVQFQKKISERIRRLGRIVIGVAITVLVMLGGMAHLLKWI